MFGKLKISSSLLLIFLYVCVCALCNCYIYTLDTYDIDDLAYTPLYLPAHFDMDSNKSFQCSIVFLDDEKVIRNIVDSIDLERGPPTV
jgi:hypothetical protein